LDTVRSSRFPVDLLSDFLADYESPIDSSVPILFGDPRYQLMKVVLAPSGTQDQAIVRCEIERHSITFSEASLFRNMSGNPNGKAVSPL
jgi:hypothetical protein